MKTLKTNEYQVFENDLEIELNYPEIGNDLCFAVEENSPWFNQRNELILHFIDKHGIDGDFLDIGGGNGFQAKAILDSNFNRNVILCEPGARGCLSAKKRGVDLVYNGFFQDFPYENYTIRNIGLFDVIEHVQDDIKFLRELYDKLNKNSRIFISVPASKYLWSETDEFAGHFRRYDLGDLHRIEATTRFKLIDHTFYFNHYVIPVIISRVIPYKLGIRRGEERTLRKEQHNLKKGVLNVFFDRMHKRSMRRIKLGKRIGTGTSLFFVLEK